MSDTPAIRISFSYEATHNCSVDVNTPEELEELMAELRYDATRKIFKDDPDHDEFIVDETVITADIVLDEAMRRKYSLDQSTYSDPIDLERVLQLWKNNKSIDKETPSMFPEIE